MVKVVGAMVPNTADDVSQMYRTNYMGFASFTILIWDHIDTFPTEVEYIWKGRKGPIVYLFLLNRYLTPLGFIVNLFAYLSPVWTPERCKHFIRFEGAMTVIGINVVALMMLLRVYAMYYRHLWILCGVALLLLVQFCTNAWLLTKGEGTPTILLSLGLLLIQTILLLTAVVHNQYSGVHSCTMIFDPSLSVIASSSAWLPLLFDTVVLGLTLHRTIPLMKNRDYSYIIRRLLEDGLIYYTAIFAVTFVLTLMIIVAPPGLKNITAQLELLLTVTMMSRITLNLKKSVCKMDRDDGKEPELPSMFARRSRNNSAVVSMVSFPEAAHFDRMSPIEETGEC